MKKVIFYTLDFIASVFAWCGFRLANCRLYFWAEEGLPDITLEEREQWARELEFRDLDNAQEVLEGLIAKDKKAALAQRAVLKIMEVHFPEEWEKWRG